jgi:DNA-binding CsgD family transcriptional regulator
MTGDDLTARELEVLRLMAGGRTNGEIAERLDISFPTAKNHVSAIISKLGVETREEAVRAWKERQRVGARVSRKVRGLVGGLGIWKVAAGATGAVIVTGTSLAGLLMFGTGISFGPESDNLLSSIPAATRGSGQLSWAATPTPPPGLPDVGRQPLVLPFDTTGQVQIEDVVALLPHSVLAAAGCESASPDVDAIARAPVGDDDYVFTVSRSQSQFCVTVLRMKMVDPATAVVAGGAAFGAEHGPFDPGAPSSECGMSAPASSEPGYVFCTAAPEVAYAEVDDGSPERVSVDRLPAHLGMNRSFVAASHTAHLSEDRALVIRLYDRDNTLVGTRLLPVSTTPTSTP